MALSHKQAAQVIARSEIGDQIHRETGSGDLNTTLDIQFRTRIVSVQLHLDASTSTAQTFELSVVSDGGSEYDTLLVSCPMSGVHDVFIPTGFVIGEDDQLNLSFPNTDGSTYGLTVLYTSHI